MARKHRRGKRLHIVCERSESMPVSQTTGPAPNSVTVIAAYIWGLVWIKCYNYIISTFINETPCPCG